MGGGSSSAVTPTTPVGYTGGSVMDFTPQAFSPSPLQQGGGYDWGALIRGLGTGAKAAGKGLSGGQTPVPQPQEPQLQQSPIDSGQYQPTAIQLDPRILQALARLLGGQ